MFWLCSFSFLFSSIYGNSCSLLCTFQARDSLIFSALFLLFPFALTRVARAQKSVFAEAIAVRLWAVKGRSNRRSRLVVHFYLSNKHFFKKKTSEIYHKSVATAPKHKRASFNPLLPGTIQFFTLRPAIDTRAFFFSSLRSSEVQDAIRAIQLFLSRCLMFRGMRADY
jgi:hypothetical protein